MASIPSAAAQIRPPEDPMVGIARAMQIKSMLFGQELSAQELVNKQLTGQQVAALLQGQQRLRAAQSDQAWDPTDVDSASKIMQHYGVPLDTASGVIKAIGEIRQGRQQQSAEAISNTKNAHDFLDDQLQSVKAAPLDSKQSAYESAIQNVRKYTNLFPDGPAKTQFLAEIGNAPSLYDAHWINQQHSQLRTMSQLNEEALKTAQAREASGKGAQSEAAAALDTGKITPGSPAFAPTPQALALGASEGSPWASAIQTGEAKQAGAVEAAKAGAQFPYQRQLEQIRQEVAQTFQANKNAQDKIEGTVLKPFEEKMSQIGELQSAVQQAAQGNVTAARGVLLKLIGVTNPDGTKRYNEAEATRLMQQGNIPQRVAGTIKGLLTGDQWTDKMQSDMVSFGDAQGAVARANLNRGIGNVNRLYNTNVGQGLLQNSGGGTVRMRAPNGQETDVPQEQVEHYKSKGAVVVDTSGPPAPAFTAHPTP
jgi:hypothetical protein